MGSRPRNDDLAYIAGFLDGDGSLMLQVKNRKDSKNGWRFMFTICFYQDTRHSKPLSWIKETLGIGYLSNRNDGMTELRINGFKQTKEILELLVPYIRFKRVQAKMMLEVAQILISNKFSDFDEKNRMKIADAIEKIRHENYQSGKKISTEKIYQRLGLTPYRLSPKGRDPHYGDNTPPPTVKNQAMVDPKAGCRMKI